MGRTNDKHSLGDLAEMLRVSLHVVENGEADESERAKARSVDHAIAILDRIGAIREDVRLTESGELIRRLGREVYGGDL